MVVQRIPIITKDKIRSTRLIDHHDCVFNTVKEVLVYREYVILEKIKEFFQVYNNILSMLYFFMKGIENL